MYKVTFAPFDKTAYHANFTNKQAVKRFLEQIAKDPTWKDIPYQIKGEK